MNRTTWVLGTVVDDELYKAFGLSDVALQAAKIIEGGQQGDSESPRVEVESIGKSPIFQTEEDIVIDETFAFDSGEDDDKAVFTTSWGIEMANAMAAEERTEVGEWDRHGTGETPLPAARPGRIAGSQSP